MHTQLRSALSQSIRLLPPAHSSACGPYAPCALQPIIWQRCARGPPGVHEADRQERLDFHVVPVNKGEIIIDILEFGTWPHLRVVVWGGA
jgi:hypothetical protein